ncbi:MULTISPECIES: hypothetical protein [unclassified Rhizobium]|uniref:4'-phosphopantetheinyl transferase family protein n=1 Tax=unclassified Rhizobium TaxID=2613769 RepID=UPI0027D3BF7C|nr:MULTISPECIES: hypothetical protein [unclassified Rhizobium]MDQ4408913.1 hypothetical protein [Rhizobium sp. AN63]
MVDRSLTVADIVVAIPFSELLVVCEPAMFLNEVERAKAERFHKIEDSLRYQAAHALKRLLIGAAVGKDAVDLHFSRAAGGKPIVLDCGPLAFNLSHGGDWVAVALSRSGSIGVDVESEREDDFWQQIASAFLAPKEANNVEFLKLWTAKEAVCEGQWCRSCHSTHRCCHRYGRLGNFHCHSSDRKFIWRMAATRYNPCSSRGYRHKHTHNLCMQQRQYLKAYIDGIPFFAVTRLPLPPHRPPFLTSGDRLISWQIKPSGPIHYRRFKEPTKDQDSPCLSSTDPTFF